MCASLGIAYIGPGPEPYTFWGFKGDKYYLVKNYQAVEHGKDGKIVTAVK